MVGKFKEKKNFSSSLILNYLLKINGIKGNKFTNIDALMTPQWPMTDRITQLFYFWSCIDH